MISSPEGTTNILYMPQKESRGWQAAEHRSLGVSVLRLRRLAFGKFVVSAAELMEKHVTDLEIFETISAGCFVKHLITHLR